MGTALGFAITCGWLGSGAIWPSFGFMAHRSDFWNGYLVVVAAAGAMVLTAGALLRQPERPVSGAAAGARGAGEPESA
jgi:hypothetical protein